VSEVTITITPEMRVKVMHAETFTFVLPQDIEELEVDRFQAGVFYDELCTVLGLDPVTAGYQGIIDAVKTLHGNMGTMRGLLAEAREQLSIHASNLRMDDYDEDADGVDELCHDIDEAQSGEKVCDGCGHAGGGKCPDCGPVMGDATYKAMFGDGAEKSYSREPRQCQHGTTLYGSCMLCDSEAEQQGGAA
jgi:hypothetical protein